jgi:hypothetical protein
VAFGNWEYSDTGKLYSETGKLYSETGGGIRIRKLEPVYLENRQLYSKTGSCIRIRHKQQRSYNLLLGGGCEFDPS